MLFRQELQFKVGLKRPSPNNQGLNFLLQQFRQVLKNCVKASRARIPGKQAGIPRKQARIREERFYLLAIVCFLGTRLSRNGEAEMRNSESKQKRTNFPTGEDLGSGGISRVRQKNRSKHTRAQILACGGYRYVYIYIYMYVCVYGGTGKSCRIGHLSHLKSGKPLVLGTQL